MYLRSSVHPSGVGVYVARVRAQDSTCAAMAGLGALTNEYMDITKCTFRQDNPKRPNTKSHSRYESYKVWACVHIPRNWTTATAPQWCTPHHTPLHWPRPTRPVKLQASPCAGVRAWVCACAPEHMCVCVSEIGAEFSHRKHHNRLTAHLHHTTERANPPRGAGARWEQGRHKVRLRQGVSNHFGGCPIGTF